MFKLYLNTNFNLICLSVQLKEKSGKIFQGRKEFVTSEAQERQQMALLSQDAWMDTGRVVDYD